MVIRPARGRARRHRPYSAAREQALGQRLADGMRIGDPNLSHRSHQGPGTTEGSRKPSRSSGCSRRTRILEGDDKNEIIRFLIAVDDQHPPPRAEDEPHRLPAPFKRPADPGELLKDAK